MADEARRFYGVQFHPEVTHTLQGGAILSRFVLEICGCAATGQPATSSRTASRASARRSARTRCCWACRAAWIPRWLAALLHRAIGDQLTCVFVDHGLLRLDEGDQVMETFAEHLGVRVIRVDAEQRFLEALAGVTDPEPKRKIIGRCSSRCSRRKRPSSRTSSGWPRAPSIRT